MAERITITLPADLVERIDGLAEQSGRSRSSVIREASAQYVAGMASAEAARRRKRATDDLLAFLDELNTHPVLDDRPVLEILRELRGPLDTDATTGKSGIE